MKYEIDGVKYHIEGEGEGFPLLLLHGFTGDAYMGAFLSAMEYT